MNQVRSIQFSARVVGERADPLATVVLSSGEVQHFHDQDALAALLTFALIYGVAQLDDPRDVAQRIPALTGKPLPSWITP